MLKKRPTVINAGNYYLIKRLAWLFGRVPAKNLFGIYSETKLSSYWADFFHPATTFSEDFLREMPKLPLAEADPKDQSNVRYLGFPRKRLLYHQPWRPSRMLFNGYYQYFSPLHHTEISGQVGHVYYRPRILEESLLRLGLRAKGRRTYARWRKKRLIVWRRTRMFFFRRWKRVEFGFRLPVRLELTEAFFLFQRFLNLFAENAQLKVISRIYFKRFKNLFFRQFRLFISLGRALKTFFKFLARSIRISKFERAFLIKNFISQMSFAIPSLYARSLLSTRFFSKAFVEQRFIFDHSHLLMRDICLPASYYYAQIRKFLLALCPN